MKRYLTLSKRPTAKSSPYVQGSSSGKVNYKKLEEDTKKLEEWNKLNK